MEDYESSLKRLNTEVNDISPVKVLVSEDTPPSKSSLLKTIGIFASVPLTIFLILLIVRPRIVTFKQDEKRKLSFYRLAIFTILFTAPLYGGYYYYFVRKRRVISS